VPLPHFVAKTNRYWINPIARAIGPRVPPFMLVHHNGRSSGASYTTPVWAFRHNAEFIVALTYGPRTDWLQNLQTAGFVTATYRNREWRLTNPDVIHGHPNQQPLPWLVRRALTVIGVGDFLHVSAHPTKED
jgi:deazaflavin-dependent oxidoreductase (nitroreductase family)